MKIAVDLDEVLSQEMNMFLRWFNEKYGTSWQFEDVTDYHWSNFLGISEQQAIEDAYEFFQTDEFKNLPVYAGAKEAIARLAEDHELYVVTARQNGIKEATLNWLEKNFPGVFKEVLFANHYSLDDEKVHEKGDLCREAGCTVLIDDNVQHIDSMVDNGIELILLKKPWNQNVELPAGVRRCDNWDEVLGAIAEMQDV